MGAPVGTSLGASVASVASVGAHGYPRFLNLGAEGTRGFEQMPLAASAAPIRESVLPMFYFFRANGPAVCIAQGEDLGI